MIHFKNAAELPADFWRWPHIDPAKEWADKLTDEIGVEPEFMDKLETLRVAWSHPLVINSGYRSPAHNAIVSTTGENGPHTTARAVDLSCEGLSALLLVREALAIGFTGFGIQQKGAGRYVHLDDLTPADGFATRPWLWSY